MPPKRPNNDDQRSPTPQRRRNPHRAAKGKAVRRIAIISGIKRRRVTPPRR